MQKQYRPTEARIDLNRLAENLHLIRQNLDADSFFCPMVKANAYGHGDVQVSLRLQKEGVRYLGVGLIEEGILLRKNGITCELLFFGTFESAGAQAIIEHNMTPVLSTWKQIESLEQAIRSAKIKTYNVHVKIDTGMHRLGFSMQEIEKLVGHFQKSTLQVKGLMTHLHSAEDANSSGGRSAGQLALFAKAEAAFKEFHPKIHTLNSAGTLNLLGKTKAGVRPGLALYGISPLDKEGLSLKPVLSLHSEVIKCHSIAAGESVSYGGNWVSQKASVIGVIPIGYADGYHRSLSNKASVLFRGQRVPVIGNICMDYFMVDLTDKLKGASAEEAVGAKVTLLGQDEFGNSITAQELAKWGNTIPWEILTSISERVPRKYVGGA